MLRLTDQVVPNHTQRVRHELATAWDHLLSAAEHGATQLGDASRRHGADARERAALAALALRGELPSRQWRLAGGALAVGVLLGAAAVVGTTWLARRRRGADDIRAAAETARERAGTAAQGAAATARDTVDRARDTAAKWGGKVGEVREKVEEKLGRNDSGADQRREQAGTDDPK